MCSRFQWGSRKFHFLISSGEREQGQDFDLWVLSRIFFLAMRPLSQLRVHLSFDSLFS